MPFTRPTLTELVVRMQTDVETRLVNTGTLLRRSVLKALVRVLAAAIHLTYGFLNYIADQLFISTADEAFLEKEASEYGITRKDASYATGIASVTATIVTTIPEGARIQSGSGQVYIVDNDIITEIGSNNVAFTAVEAGADANDDAAIILSFVSSIVGVGSTLTVDSNGISGGADKETDDSLRERVLFRKKRSPHGGAEHDYINWAKEYAGVTRAWVYPEYAGIGTVALAFVRDGNTIILPTTTQIDAVTNYITKHINPATGETEGIPVTASSGFEIVTLTDYVIKLVIQLYPNTITVQTSVTTELDSYLLRSGGPAQTLYLSEINETISGAAGEQRHRLISPISDISPTFTQMPSFSITFEDYA